MSEREGRPYPLYNMFAHMTPSNESHGLWRYPEGNDVSRGYLRLERWLELARTLERGRFDMLFLGDTLGPSSVYGGSPETAIRAGMQFPSGDPSVLISAMASVTEHLGFVMTSSVIQAHPFEFARRMSTLDHLTDGRIGWNVVTSYIKMVAGEFGLDELPQHDARYRWADEYLAACYALWESSWEDGAVLSDAERNILFDPEKVHSIHHRGERYRIDGPHCMEPSPQRTPFICQAGQSEQGRSFAGRNAEGVFIVPLSPEIAAKDVADLRARAVAAGREPWSVRALVGFCPIIGSTEEEAKRRQRELRERLDLPALLAFYSELFNTDLSLLDQNATIAELLEGADQASAGTRTHLTHFTGDGGYAGIGATSSAVKGAVRGMLEGVSDKSQRFGDYMRWTYATTGLEAGTPEQLADALERWIHAGVGGFNIVPVTTLRWIDEWVDEVVPILQARGLMRREYDEGTLRHKVFGAGPTLTENHPARRSRTTDLTATA